ncbi:unnamed protein product, partial [Larinioides sclopetarius]
MPVEVLPKGFPVCILNCFKVKMHLQKEEANVEFSNQPFQRSSAKFQRTLRICCFEFGSVLVVNWIRFNKTTPLFPLRRFGLNLLVCWTAVLYRSTISCLAHPFESAFQYAHDIDLDHLCSYLYCVNDQTLFRRLVVRIID